MAGTTGGLGRFTTGAAGNATLGFGRMSGGCRFTRLGISEIMTGGSLGYGREPPVDTGGGGGGGGTAAGGCARTGVCTGKRSGGGGGGKTGGGAAATGVLGFRSTGTFDVVPSGAMCSKGSVEPGASLVPSGLRVMDSDGALPSKMDAGSFISGSGISFTSSPGLGGS
jgi:hypothetical protein